MTGEKCRVDGMHSGYVLTANRREPGRAGQAVSPPQEAFPGDSPPILIDVVHQQYKRHCFMAAPPDDTNFPAGGMFVASLMQCTVQVHPSCSPLPHAQGGPPN